MKERLTEKLAGRISKEAKEKLDRIAEEQFVPQSAVYRQAVREFIDNHEKKQNGKGK